MKQKSKITAPHALSRRDMIKTAALAVGGMVAADSNAGMVEEHREASTISSSDGKDSLPSGAILAKSEFPSFQETNSWDKQGRWPASWIQCPGAEDTPVVSAFRLVFTMPAGATARIHVSADERYELFLDGHRVGRGSERGNLENWFYETYNLELSAGPHCLVARVWSLGDFASLPQFHVRHEFLLAAEGEQERLLNTGLAKWEAKRLEGYSFKPPVYVWGLSAPMTVEARRFPWGFERGEGEGWVPAKTGERASSTLMAYGIAPSRYLRRGTLPPMVNRPWQGGSIRLVAAVPSLDTASLPIQARAHLKEESEAWASWLKGQTRMTIPAHTRRRVLIDLEDYLCAYPELITTGGLGSQVRLQWAEGLRTKPDMWNFDKGHRDEIEGKYFFGMGDTFLPDGGRERRFDTLWWACGRYLEVVVHTGNEPLTLDRFTLHETRYPLEMESAFTASDPGLTRLVPLLTRGMQMCAHETFVDCPYFEQMQYVADARLEALCCYLMTRDDRLPRKAIYLIDQSRHAAGLTESRYPVRSPQFIPWFSLVWIGMVHDYARWRNDPALVQSMMPGIRAVLETFLARIDHRGVLRTPEGWNNTDATQETGESGLTHWLLVWTLDLAAELERHFGETELAGRCQRKARELARVANHLFWDDARGFYADAPEKNAFSEPVQCMAVLSGHVPEDRLKRLRASLGSTSSITMATVHTTYYLLEVCQRFGSMDLFFSRLKFWTDLQRKGLKTPIESREPTRSDCHAWASHPLIHFYSTILGIRPASFGFKTVLIAPQLGPLKHASGTLIHPGGGEISVEFESKYDSFHNFTKLHGHVKLPDGVTGILRFPSSEMELRPGTTHF